MVVAILAAIGVSMRGYSNPNNRPPPYGPP
jgi:hypothetical protein